MKRFLLFIIATISILGANAQSPITDCAECSKRLLTKSDINDLDYNSLYLLRNEIYARKGYRFSITFLNDYFREFAWYKPLTDNKSLNLDSIELKNIEFLGLSMMDEVNHGNYIENERSSPLSQENINLLFPVDKRMEMKLSPSITNTYQFEDKSGKYLWVLSERSYQEASNEKGVFNDNIQAIKYRLITDSNKVKLVELNSITDKIKEEKDAFLYNNEVDISFVPKYTYIDDLDNDGILEQVITTQTTQVNGYSDNRLNIYIFSNNLKTKIKIYNCAVESGLYIEVDKSFYALPVKTRDNIMLQMETMLIEGLCFLPKGWKNKMSKGMLNIK